jgi:hypothetical protein
MAVDSTIKRKTASGYDEIHPKTNADQVEGLATALANITIDSLNDIADVNAPSPADGQALVWHNTTSKWIPGDAGGGDVQTVNGVSPDVNGEVTLSASDLDGITATTTELNYVDGVTSSIQTQLNDKQGTIVGAASTITGSDLTASRALVSNSSGKVAVSAVTSTEIGYLDGVTSAIQTQLDDKATVSQLNLKAPLASPALTGTPTAPTTATSDDSTKIATTAYVKNVVSDLIGGAPAALDTLNELAQALADDAEFSATITTALAGKLGINGTAVNSDKIDGYHIVVGSTGSDANTLYFTT